MGWRRLLEGGERLVYAFIIDGGDALGYFFESGGARQACGGC